MNPTISLKKTLLLFAVAVGSPLLTVPVSRGQDAAKDSAADAALEQYYIANGAYNRKLYPVAITQYEGFLEKHAAHPKADLARQGLALSLHALKQYDKAMPHLAALLAKADLDAAISRERLIMLQGQCLQLTGKKDEARTLFVAEIANLKNEAYQAGALAAICDVCFGKSEWQEVLTWSGKLLAAKPGAEQAARACYQQGYAQYQLQQVEAAIAVLGKIAALKADALWQTRADYLLGECYNQRQQFDKAEAAFVAALPGLTGKDASECRYRLGLTRFVLKKYREAAADLAAYLAAAKDGPQAAEARLYIARSQFELGELAKAGPALTELAAGEGDVAAQASLWLARVHTRKDKNYAKAAEILAAAAERFKDSPLGESLRFDQANALMALKEPDWTAALALLQGIEAQAKFPQLAEVLSQRAVCQHKLGDYTNSLAANDAFLAKFADHPLVVDVRFMRAENLFLLNRLDEAAKAYAEFVASHKDHPNALAANFRLAQIHHDQGNWEKCLASAVPMLESKPEGRLFAQLPFIVGDCLFRLEKWAEAVAGLETFLATRVTAEAGKSPVVTAEPNVDTALMQLAVAEDRLEQQEKALKYLGLLVSHYPEATPQLPLALAEQGRLAFEKGDLKLARKALERFAAEDKKDAEPFTKGAPAQRARVMYYLGWVEASEEHHDAAARCFGEVRKLDPQHALAPDAELQQGIAWVNSGNFEAAAKHFQEMLGRYPQHEKLPRLVFYTGLSLARLKQWDPAKTHFKRIIDSFATSEFADQALYEWAWCERRLERNAEAVKLYEQLLASHATSPLAVKVQSELAELNLESGQQDKVIERLTETMTKVKDPALREDISYQLASAYFKKGDHATAAKQFEKLLADYPASKLLASILFQAGESRLKLGETVAARGHFVKAAQVPDSPESLAESITMRLAETQALTNEHAAAAKSYAAFLEKFPKSRWTRNARFGLGFAMENGGDSAKAIPEYRQLLADKTVDLWTVRARFQIGECYFNLQQYDEAVAEFVNVEINFGKYPDWQAKAVLETARVLIAQGKKAQAVERLKELIVRFPKEKAATVAQQLLDELRIK